MRQLMDKVAQMAAILGGLVLAFLITLTTLSILGRELNSALHGVWFATYAPAMAEYLLDLGLGQIKGDYELVEAAMAFVIFAFLPVCTVRQAHARIDLLSPILPRKFQRITDHVVRVVFFVVLAIITRQLFLGLLDKYQTGQSSYLMQIPIWWAYAAALSAAGVAVVISALDVLFPQAHTENEEKRE